MYDIELGDPGECGSVRGQGSLSSISFREEKLDMKLQNAKLVLIGVLTFSISLLIISQIPAGVSFAQQQAVEAAEYSCPMHPEVKSKTAGSCPKCGMHLKQVSKTDVADAKEDSRWG